MKARPYPRWISRLFILAVGMLAFTGMMQMPLANRYFLTRVPGMAWTGDFFIVHKLHYGFAALLLFIAGLTCANWLLNWRKRLTLTPMGAARVAILAGLVVSGVFRVYRNIPSVTLDPTFVLVIEWIHLGLTMVLGGVALAALIRKASAYARLK